MNDTPSAGLSSCQLTSSPTGAAELPSLLGIADYCSEEQPYTVGQFSTTTTVVAPPAPADNPFSIVAARNRRDQAKRRPVCRAA